MQINVQAFCLPKAGNSPDEYEDAFQYNESARSLAIADGASDAFESRLWAQALVRAFVRQPPMLDANGILEWLKAPIKVWKEGIDWEKLPWYSAEKARRGAFSTFLGLTLSQQERECYQWRAAAVGDACLFQVRDNELLLSFPLQHAADFGTTPALLSTRVSYSQRSLDALQVVEGECRGADLLMVSTDSFAAWFLSRSEIGERPWLHLLQLSQEEFREFVDRARVEGQMRNDDVTFLVIGVEEFPVSDQLDGLP